ncbi:MAG: cell division topological specificity factor MinE [Anaerolineae bacterium]
MTGLLERLLGRSPAKGSGTTAKERLQFILVHDRINLPPERLQAMKAEILEVISKYVAVERDDVDIFLEQRNRDSLIKAEIPFSGVNTQDEARNRMLTASNSDDDSLDDG